MKMHADEAAYDIASTFLVIMIAIMLHCQSALCAYQLEYVIDVRVDGSAYWIIEQKGIGVQPSFEAFCQKVNLILEEAKVKTSRNMAAEDPSMIANLSGSYAVIKYQFLWKNFSLVESSRIKIGDIFEVENFFEKLYGNGEVRLKYPLEYFIESVSPSPHEQDPTTPVLVWYGIEDFKIGEPKIILREKSSASGLLEIISQNWILITILTALLVGGGSVGFHYFRRQKLTLRRPIELESSKVEVSLKVEDAEQKIVNLLRAAGGSMHQSKIAEKCGFSRAKVSKLLKVMEDKAVIKREQKGREKIVTLVKEVESERS